MLRVNQKQMFIVLYLLTKYILPRNDDFLLSAILVTFFTVYNCSPYSITKHLEMIFLWRRCAMWRLLIYLLTPGRWWWTRHGDIDTPLQFISIWLSWWSWLLIVDTGLSMTNWIYHSTFHPVLMCGLFLVYRVDAIEGSLENRGQYILYIYECNRRCDASALTVQQTHTLRRTSE